MSYRTANLQMLHFIHLFKNIRTEYFKHAAHSPFFSSSKCCLFHNATFFGSCIIHILNTECVKFKRKIRLQRVKLLEGSMAALACLSKMDKMTRQISRNLFKRTSPCLIVW